MTSRSDETLWQGSAWRLVGREIHLPGGVTRKKPIIDHPGSVVLLPLLEDRVVMVWQYRLALDQSILELPAGTRHAGEAWEECAQRELREETGYRAAQFVSLGHIWPGPGLTNEQMRLYLATGLTLDPLPQDEDEQIEIRLLPLEPLLRMALDGDLEDAKSIIGIIRAAHHLKI